MNNEQIRKKDKFGREDVFITSNASDFPADSPVALLTVEINIERQKILQFEAQQSSGFAGKRQAQEIYDNRRRELLDLLDKFILAAAIIDDQIEGLAAKFRNPYPRSNQKLIARANSFYADSADIGGELLAAGLGRGERDALLTISGAFQQAAAAHDLAEGRHTEASGGLKDSFRKAMALSKRRDKRVRMKYRDNAAKLAGWASASHLDRTPKRKESTTAPVA